MALKTLRFVQGLPRTPLLIFFDMFKNQMFPNYFPEIDNLEILKSEIGKPRFTNKCPDLLNRWLEHDRASMKTVTGKTRKVYLS